MKNEKSKVNATQKPNRPVQYTGRLAIGILIVILAISAGIGAFWHFSQYNCYLPPGRMITVWVHGTRGQEVTPLIFSSQEEAQAEHEICFCPPGLHQIDNLEIKYHLSTIGKVLCDTCKNTFPRESFYVFGWTGALSFSARKETAQQLYHELKQVHGHFTKTDGVAPRITIITHSHGGNVALNMAHIYGDDTEKSECVIDNLILLACPVQKATASLAESELFKKIYSLHSHLDALQILDPQGLHELVNCSAEAWQSWSLSPLKAFLFGERNRPIFSERHFMPNKKIKQARIRWEHTHPWTDEDVAIFAEFSTMLEGTMIPYIAAQRDLLHVEFILPSFLRKLPNILKRIDDTPIVESPVCDEDIECVIDV